MTFTRHLSGNPRHFVPSRCRSAAAAAALPVVPGGAGVAGLGGMAHAAVSDEGVALGLATLLRSARAVLSKNQKLINDETRGDKGPTSAAVLAKAKENYTKVTGVDIDSIDSPSVQGGLLKAETGAALRLLVTEAVEKLFGALKLRPFGKERKFDSNKINSLGIQQFGNAPRFRLKTGFSGVFQQPRP